MIHGHGNNINKYPKLVADFSSNVWYKGMPKELISVLADNMFSITDYPEPDAGKLKYKIANCFGLDENNVIVTNGSTEAFYLIAQTFAGRKSDIAIPCFSEYHDACQLHHHQIAYISNSSDWQYNRFEDLVWFANPNNPDGNIIPIDEILVLLKNNPTVVFVLDEAYTELCYGVKTAIPLLAEYENLIIVRSFTKAFSIPGIRLGYILSSKSIINKIKAFLMPWSVNSIAISAGIYIIEHYERLLPDKQIIRLESVELQNEINKNEKMKVFSSNCNFFLVQSLFRPASELKEYLINEFRILIRDASNFKGLDNSFFRIAIQNTDMNKLLINGINQWMQ